MPTVYSIPWWYQQFFDSNGDPLSGGKVRTKYAGTSDDKTTYSDSDGSTEQSNPIILDSKGLPTAGPIFMLSGAYDFYLYDSDDVLQDTIEGINAQTATDEVDTVDDLKALTAGSTSFVRTLGYSAANDGGGWIFYWNSTSTASDDGGMVIQPDSLPATGRWIGLLPPDGQLDLKTYGAACDGTTDDITELQACDTYCAANNLIILISDNTYFATDPSLSSKVKLLPSCQLRWGNINPTLDVIIDGNDKTQHFNNNATYIPTLNVNEIYPEWFGETEASHAITTAAIAALSGQKHKFITQYRFKDVLDADVGADIEGDVDVAGNLTVGNIISNDVVNLRGDVDAAPADGEILFNAYHDGSDYRRIQSANALRIYSNGGTLHFYSVGGGAADSVISSWGTPNLSIYTGGNITCKLPLDADAGADIEGAVDIQGILTLQAELNADAGADIEGNVDIAGTLTLQSELDADAGADIEGNVDINGTLDVQDSVTLYDLQVTGLIDANAGMDVEGNVDIAGTLDVHSGIDIVGGLDVDSDHGCITIGADAGTTGRTDSEEKNANFGSVHYLNAEEDTCVLRTKNDSTTNRIYIGGNAAELNAATEIGFYTAANYNTLIGTERFRIESDGGIFANNLASDTGTALILNGSNEICTDSSSIRFKENVREFSIDSSILQQFKLHDYTWKDTGKNDFGFIAEELADAFPGMETYNHGEVQAWDIKKMLILAVAEIQRLHKEVELLKITLC